MPPDLTLLMFVLSAAGFIATSASTSSPGVKISVLLKWTWYPLTPASVPAGARISAGKSGSVLMSFPTKAEVSGKCVPASCMPSPGSAARRIVTEGRLLNGLAGGWRWAMEEAGGDGGGGAAGVSRLMSYVASKADLKTQI